MNKKMEKSKRAPKEKPEFEWEIFAAQAHFRYWFGNPENTLQFPYFMEAVMSTLPGLKKIMGAWTRPKEKISKLQPEYPGVPIEVLRAFVLFDQPLSKCSKRIFKAAENEDYQFFKNFGKIIKDKDHVKFETKRIGPDSSLVPLMATIWHVGSLWLMTDKAGVAFLRGVMKKEVTEDAYKKARTRLNLYKHPNMPIIGITPLPVEETPKIWKRIYRGPEQSPCNFFLPVFKKERKSLRAVSKKRSRGQVRVKN